MEEGPAGTGTKTPLTSAVAIVILAIVTTAEGVLATMENPLSNEAIDRRIQKHRTAEIDLTVTDVTGKPAANTPVTVQMDSPQVLVRVQTCSLWSDPGPRP